MQRNIKRNEKVVWLYDEKGLTFEQIGSIMKPRITKQRAWQIYTHEKPLTDKLNGSIL